MLKNLKTKTGLELAQAVVVEENKKLKNYEERLNKIVEAIEAAVAEKEAAIKEANAAEKVKALEEQVAASVNLKKITKIVETNLEKIKFF